MRQESTLVISELREWEEFREAKLDTIVDPLVFRSADVFLRGRQGAIDTLTEKNSTKIWESVSDNLGLLLAFFDALVLSEKLPIIDYGRTFDSVMHAGQNHQPPWICATVNRALEDEVLVDVHVQGSASLAARNAALQTLQSRPQVSPEFEERVRRELSTFDYQWKPDLGDLWQQPEENLVLPRFLYGGLVFTAFAQMSGAAHLLQPKRNELFQSLALAVPPDQERELFEELNRRIKAAPEFQEIPAELVSWPPCLPYLLSRNPTSPTELLQEAFELRKTKEAADYRGLRHKIFRNWTDKGLIDPTHEKDMKRFVLEFHKALKVAQKVPVEAGAEFKIEATGVGITPTVKLDAPIGAIWGWILANIPGRRYLKLLLRLSRAAYSYPHFDRHLLTIWNRA
jgi:hypothetical protein